MHKLGTLYFPMIGIKIHVKVIVKPWSQDWLIAAGAYPSFCTMKQLEVFLLPLDGMLVHRRSLPCNLLGCHLYPLYTHLYTWVERGTVRVRCVSPKNTTQRPRPALEPGSLALESSALTTRPPLLPSRYMTR